MPEGQLWPFLCIRNSKLSKNSRSELGEDVVYLPKPHVLNKTSRVYSFANNVRRNDFAGNNSRMN